MVAAATATRLPNNDFNLILVSIISIIFGEPELSDAAPNFTIKATLEGGERQRRGPQLNTEKPSG